MQTESTNEKTINYKKRTSVSSAVYMDWCNDISLTWTEYNIAIYKYDC